MSTATRDLSFLSMKALLASFVTLLLDRLAGNPDHVSSTFVAVLSVSAVALAGLRQGLAQLTGSAVGGVWGTLATFAGLPHLAAVPLAVAAAIVSAFAARAAAGYPIAAFTALYLVLVPQGTPLETFGIRLLAVSCGVVGGLVVNVAVSSFAYRRIYVRRLADAEARIRALLPAAAGRGPDAAESGFALLAELQRDLDHALTELRWRRARRFHADVRRLWWRVEHLRSLLHLAANLGWVVRREDLQRDAIAPLLAWLAAPSGPAPAVPAAIAEPVGRVEGALKALGAEGASPGSTLPSGSGTSLDYGG